MRDPIRRKRLVAELAERGIRDRRVLDGIGDIPRSVFVDEALDGTAYTDASLPIGGKQTISQPGIVARMNELLEPDGTGRVLEIGTGSGYHAAVLSRLFEQVYSVERILAFSRKAKDRIRELGIENVHFKVFDGSYGWREFAPYRAIVVTAAVPDVPSPLVEQLELGGRLVLPVIRGGGGGGSDGDQQVLVRVVRTAEAFEPEEHGRCKFVPLIGKYGRDK